MGTRKKDRIKMKNIREVISESTYGFRIPSYKEIVNTFANILIQVDDNDYQGDSRLFLITEFGKLGHLQFGWGSCSGCDALQACNTIEDLEELQTTIFKSVKWFNTKADALEYFEKHDWEGDYSYSSAEQKTYIEKVLNMLRS
jgi:hypothetical protein